MMHQQAASVMVYLVGRKTQSYKITNQQEQSGCNIKSTVQIKGR